MISKLFPAVIMEVTMELYIVDCFHYWQTEHHHSTSSCPIWWVSRAVLRDSFLNIVVHSLWGRPILHKYLPFGGWSKVPKNVKLWTRSPDLACAILPKSSSCVLYICIYRAWYRHGAEVRMVGFAFTLLGVPRGTSHGISHVISCYPMGALPG